MASYNSAKIKGKLNNAISCACERIDEFKRSPNDFTRTRSLTPEVMVRTILGLHGQRLDKEMILAGTDVSASAFVGRGGGPGGPGPGGGKGGGGAGGAKRRGAAQG